MALLLLKFAAVALFVALFGAVMAIDYHEHTDSASTTTMVVTTTAPITTMAPVKTTTLRPETTTGKITTTLPPTTMTKSAETTTMPVPTLAPRNIDANPTTAVPLTTGKPKPRPNSTVWTYNDVASWGQFGTTCASGQHQSPINVNTSDVIRDETLYDSPLFWNSYRRSISGTLINNGRMIQFIVNASIPADKRPSIWSEAFGKDKFFPLDQIIFHWSTCSTCRGSEHTIDGRVAQGEMQLVHFNKNYENFNEAIKHPNGVHVLSFLLREAGVDSPDNNQTDFSSIINNPNCQLPKPAPRKNVTEIRGPQRGRPKQSYRPPTQALGPRQAAPNQMSFFSTPSTPTKRTTLINVSNFTTVTKYLKRIPKAGNSVSAVIDLTSLRPGPIFYNDPAYYRYEGSLTWPPCSETVLWTVFNFTIPIPTAIFQEFRAVSALPVSDPVTGRTVEEKMVNNYRPEQALNGRAVRTNKLTCDRVLAKKMGGAPRSISISSSVALFAAVFSLTFSAF